MDGSSTKPPKVTKTEATHVRKIIAGIQVPDSKLARGATDLLREHGTPLLYAHSLRVFVFGSLRGRRRGLQVDHELLYVGAVFHDLGLTPNYRSRDHRFEIDSANAARDYLLANGIDDESAQVVWDAIALAHDPGGSLAQAARKSRWSLVASRPTSSATRSTRSPRKTGQASSPRTRGLTSRRGLSGVRRRLRLPAGDDVRDYERRRAGSGKQPGFPADELLRPDRRQPAKGWWAKVHWGLTTPSCRRASNWGRGRGGPTGTKASKHPGNGEVIDERQSRGSARKLEQTLDRLAAECLHDRLRHRPAARGRGLVARSRTGALEARKLGPHCPGVGPPCRPAPRRGASFRPGRKRPPSGRHGPAPGEGSEPSVARNVAVAAPPLSARRARRVVLRNVDRREGRAGIRRPGRRAVH